MAKTKTRINILGGVPGSKSALKRDLKERGDSGEYIQFVPAPGEDVEVRFLEEPWEMFSYWEHYDSRQTPPYYPCIGEDDCEGCMRGADRSKKYLANVVLLEDDRVVPFKLPVSLVNDLQSDADKGRTILNRAYTLWKEGKGLQTEYKSYAGDQLRDSHDAYVDDMHDHEEVLISAWERAFTEPEDDEDEDERETPAERRAARRRKDRGQRRGRRRSEPEDLDEDEDDEDEDEPPRRRRSSGRSSGRSKPRSRARDEDDEDDEEDERTPRRRRMGSRRKPRSQRAEPEDLDTDEDDEGEDEDDEDFFEEAENKRRRRVAREEADDEEDDEPGVDDDDDENVVEVDLTREDIEELGERANDGDKAARKELKEIAKRADIDFGKQTRTSTLVEKILERVTE